MGYKLKKVNNQIYIVDVDAEIKEGDWSTDGEFIVLKTKTNSPLFQNHNPVKVIATPDQIDIDNLFEKWLEAEAEKHSNNFNASKMHK